jgi:hypothetical protein
MEVLNIDVDLYNFNNYLTNNQRFYDSKEDYQIVTHYINENTFSILVKRLDTDEGWDKDLNVLVVYLDNDTSLIVNIGNSNTYIKEIIVNSDIKINQSSIPVTFLPSYKLVDCPEPQRLSRDEFNFMFGADVTHLPTDMYAFGLNDKKVFVYSDHCKLYYETIRQIRHIFKVALTFTDYNKFYFVVTVVDGYL